MALLTIFLFCFIASLAQEGKPYTLSLEGVAPSDKVSLPFRAISVIDARFDQKHIGLLAKDLSYKGITQNKTLAIFPEELRHYLPKLVSGFSTLDSSGTDTLSILVKQFRLTDHFSHTPDKDIAPQSILTISCSFYKSTNGRLFRIAAVDDVIAQYWGINGQLQKEEVPALRTEAVMKLLQRVFQNRDWTATEVSFPSGEVEEGVAKRLQVSALTDRSLAPGIYKTFKEFKNNTPSITEFKIGRRYDGAIKEVIDSKGTLMHPDEFWGLCDGEDRYVNFHGGIYKLAQAGNNFRFIFYRELADAQLRTTTAAFDVPKVGRATIPMPYSMAGSPSDFTPEFLYLNMDNGQVHVEELIGTKPLRKLKARGY